MPISLKIQRNEPPDLQIEKYVRQQIDVGELEPGERLPTNTSLARMLGVSCRDVQKALARLTISGLVSRAPKRGTFVRGSTEKEIIGLLFGPPLTNEVTYFYRAMLGALRAETKQRRYACRPYDGLAEVDPDEPHHEHALHNLKRDLRSFGFKGAIYISPHPDWTQPLEREFRLPTACFASTVPDFDVQWDTYRFGRDAVAYLAEKGRRKLAFLRTQWRSMERFLEFDGFCDEIRARGLSQPDILQVSRTTLSARQEAEIQQAVAQAIRHWQSRPEGMPDGLVVNDDVSMRVAALALLAAGVRVPDELMIVTFANEGVNLHYGLPVVRYEFSTTEVARQLVEVLRKRMAGETIPPLRIRIQGQTKEEQT
jgi:DNA-binding LacI/PurR family transcriptional regulator